MDEVEYEAKFSNYPALQATIKNRLTRWARYLE